VPSAEPRLVYADSSALVKLVIEEPESAALDEHLVSQEHALATSRIALVEVERAVTIANPTDEARAEARRLLDSCHLVDVSDSLLRAAARQASRAVRTLDAIHLASAQRVGADEVLAYDRRLAEAARAAGFTVKHPGT
jgi:hypothetical protein